MVEVTETQLPGVGVRYEFTTDDGERVAVIHHHSGRRDLVVYDRDDPDTSRLTLELDEGDARTLTDLLGASRVAEALGSARQRIEGLSLDWIEVLPSSSLADRTIGDGRLRTRTGASIVAVIRADTTEPAPGPEFVLRGGDVAVAVGTDEGLTQVRSLLRG